MSTHKWATPGNLTTILSTGLNSLADSANAISSAVDNTSDLYQNVVFEIQLASFTPGTNPYIRLYLLYSIDGGTTYADGGASTDPAFTDIVAEPAVITGTGAKVIVTKRILLLPFHWKLLFENKTGAALAAASNTVKYKLFHEQDV